VATDGQREAGAERRHGRGHLVRPRHDCLERTLATAYEAAGLTFEDFQGHSFVRLNELKRLLEDDALDGELRWRR